MQTRGGEGVKNPENFADVICTCPLVKVYLSILQGDTSRRSLGNVDMKPMSTYLRFFQKHILWNRAQNFDHQISLSLSLSNGNSIFTVMMGGRWFSATLGDNPSVARVQQLAVEHLQKIIQHDKAPVRFIIDIVGF